MVAELLLLEPTRAELGGLPDRPCLAEPLLTGCDGRGADRGLLRLCQLVTLLPTKASELLPQPPAAYEQTSEDLRGLQNAALWPAAGRPLWLAQRALISPAELLNAIDNVPVCWRMQDPHMHKRAEGRGTTDRDLLVQDLYRSRQA